LIRIRDMTELEYIRLNNRIHLNRALDLLREVTVVPHCGIDPIDFNASQAILASIAVKLAGEELVDDDGAG
jgi:hypothetical protein